MSTRKNIGFLIKQINNNYEREFNNALKKYDLTASQCEVLDYLFSCKDTVVCTRDVQKALNFKQPTATGILMRMEEKHFVEMVNSSEDKRCKNIHLTQNAYELKKKMEKEHRRVEKMLLEGMEPEEKDALYRQLKKALENIVE